MKIKTFTYIMVVIGMLLFQNANAQINLEHTFDGNVGHNGAFFTPTIDYYTYFNTETKQVRLYKEDYFLYKSINIVPPVGYSILGVYLYSKDIATTDGKITFFIQFNNPDVISTNPNSYSSLRLYNEDGVIVKDFGYAYISSQSFHRISNNAYRLSIMRYIMPTPVTYETDIYSLPGTAPVGIISQEYNNSNIFPYPNPANSTITLPYKLNQGETSVMRIYNLNGQLIENKQIDFIFDEILLNVSNYTKGVYFYEVNGKSNKFIVN